MQLDAARVNRTWAMAKEIEAKFRLADPGGLRARLAALGAVRSGRVLETNRIFDTPEGRLRQAGCGLRVRTCRPWPEGGAAVPTETTGGMLTFKGPRAAGALKSREELETELCDPAAAVSILQRLNLREVIVYEKRRETWRLGELEVALDELPRLGSFVEIEGPTEDAVQGARRELGLADEPLVSETYVHLVAAHGQLTEDGRRQLLF